MHRTSVIKSVISGEKPLRHTLYSNFSPAKNASKQAVFKSTLLRPFITLCSNRRQQKLQIKRIAITRGGIRSLQTDLTPSDSQRATIYALSTPPGKAGVAVVRISGPNVLNVWHKMTESAGKARDRVVEPQPWKMYLRRIVHPNSGDILDEGLAVYFKAPSSFTSEDVLELHVHSSPAVITAVLRGLSCLPYCRLAEPGEFTRRAFAANRLDLTQVEGLKDLVHSETESQRILALRATSGVIRDWVEKLRSEILGCLALVEALIDFSEEDIEEGVYKEAKNRVHTICNTIERQLSNYHRGEIMRSGIRMTIFGPPNAGKSSLFNTLARREAAIVTSEPGTTRDVLEISLDIGGLPVIVADTAGLRHTTDIVEKIGIERANDKIVTSDLSLCVLSLPEIQSSEDASITIPPTIASKLSSDNTFVLLNKADLMVDLPPKTLRALCKNLNISHSWAVSLTTGEGVQEFLQDFGTLLHDRYGPSHDGGNASAEPLITHSRHRSHLENTLRFLQAFLSTDEEDVVFGAEELRYAAQAVGKISGRIDVEDVLDVIFRDFCIGK